MTTDLSPTFRNLVVCCDGTANEFAPDRTNVVKLCYGLVKDANRQLVYYHPGIGTKAPPGFVTGLGTKIAKIAGMAFGYGLKRDVVDAYEFIMNHHRPDDRLFIFGFSRGAYTARVVAALIKLYGVIMPGNEALVPYMVDMLWAIEKARGDKSRVNGYFKLASDFKQTLSAHDCKPYFVGVWDTVSSVGWVGSPTALPYTHDNPDIQIVRHAVSIDERRAFFRANLFATPDGRDIKQIWFAGVHCDVGGGYKDEESGLSRIALKWMIEEAEANGLLVDPQRRADVLDERTTGSAKPTCKIHNSLTWKWWPAEFVPKRHYDKDTDSKGWRINFFRRRWLGNQPVIHDSAWILPDYYAIPPDAIRASEKWPAPNASTPASKAPPP
ncbi:DUF2235 domain-containing protein [Agrobacterium rhizogenes]|nr:DUF2235 domain-containing protein [Rhizobium rhizogenes]NTG32274.1 DUF2235 domain-containing protein [Rhizobium rhizogenes]